MAQDKATLLAKVTELKALLAQQVGEKRELEIVAAKCAGREKANASKRLKAVAERIKKTKLALANTISRIKNHVARQTPSPGEEQEQRLPSREPGQVEGKSVDKAAPRNDSRNNSQPAGPPGHHPHPLAVTQLPRSSATTQPPHPSDNSASMSALSRKRQASITQEDFMWKKMCRDKGAKSADMEEIYEHPSDTEYKGGEDESDTSDTKYKEGEESNTSDGDTEEESDTSDGDTEEEAGGDDGDEDCDRQNGGSSANQAEIPAKKKPLVVGEEYHRFLAESYVNPRIIKQPKIPPGMRDLVRKDPNYLDDVVTIDYDLALEFLKNNRGNYLCIHHVTQNRKLNSKEVDNLEGPMCVWGTAFQRKQNADKKSGVQREPGHLHCGCPERIALARLIMFKNWKVKAMINNQLIEEGLQRPLSPRAVLFFLQFLRSNFGYTVEDMFTGSFDAEDEAEKRGEVMKKVANFCARKYSQLTGRELLLDRMNDDRTSVGDGGEWY